MAGGEEVFHLFGRARMADAESPEHESACEILMAVHQQAEFAAELVHHYLNLLGFVATPDKPSIFPRWFLFDLGTALQIAYWELAGLIPHIPEALPRSLDLIKSIFAVSEDPEAFVARAPDQVLSVRVLVIHLRYFAFRPLPFKAALIMDTTTEADFVDALATLLWRTRNQPVGNRLVEHPEHS
jgi:hypothetical protein